MRQRSCSSSIERAQTARSVCVLSEPQRVEAFNGLPRGWAGEFLLQLSSVDQADLLLALPEREPRIWLRLLLPDDTADLFQHAPEEERDRIAARQDEAIGYLRHQASDVENVYYAYVLDEAQRLLGVVGFRDLFAAYRPKLVRDVMRTNFVSVSGRALSGQPAPQPAFLAFFIIFGGASRVSANCVHSLRLWQTHAKTRCFEGDCGSPDRVFFPGTSAAT